MSAAALWSAIGERFKPAVLPHIPDVVQFSRSAGIVPDPWQERVLRSTAQRIILLCSRQSGKSTTAATLAMYLAAYTPRSMILMGAPKQDIASELLLKARATLQLAGPDVIDLNSGLERYALHNAVTRMRLPNHSRIVVLPGSPDTVRGFSAVDLLVVDEAAYVDDRFYQAVFPMLAVSNGRMALMSTPHAKTGAFYDIWTNAPDWDERLTAAQQPDAWLKISVDWRQCPRIAPGVVSEYAARFGEAAMRREFCCEFQDSVGGVFTAEQVARIAKPGVEAWDDLW